MTVLYYCWSVLFLWSFCVTLDETTRIQVHEVDICPINQSSWEKALRDLNCTDPESYQCTPNENQTALFEYCYDMPPTLIEKGYCWILLNSFYTNTFDCSGFTEGCPNMTYRSSELYKHQKCLQVNKIEGCYLADPKCPNLEEKPQKAKPTHSTTIVTRGGSTPLWNNVLLIGAGIVVLVILVGVIIFLMKKNSVCCFSAGGKYEQQDLCLDEIQNNSKEIRSFLLCCLLLDDFRFERNKQIDWEEKLKLSWNYCNGKFQKNTIENILKTLNNGQSDCILTESQGYQLKFPDKVFESFQQEDGFLAFFLEHACSQNISIYCRSPGYRKDKDEVCCTVNSEQFKVVVQRLQFDIMTNKSIEDKTCHKIIEDVLEIPKGILSLGRNGISQFLKDLKQGQHLVYIARGMLVGYEGAGKSSLLCRLRGERMPNPPSTRGIDVNVNMFTMNEEGLEVTANQNKACLRSNIKKQTDPTAVKIQIEEDPKSQQSEDCYVRDGNIRDVHNSTQITPETNTSQVTELTYPNEITPNENANTEETNLNETLTKEPTEDMFQMNINSTRSDDKDDSTKVSITQAVLESFSEKGEKIITFFDFAGQFAYYACHHIYFSSSDFYLLVFDMSKDLSDVVAYDKTNAMFNQGHTHDDISDGRKKMERSIYDNWTYLEYIEYWLQSILTHSAGAKAAEKKGDKISPSAAPVILIGTHAEGKTKQEAEAYWKDLREKLNMFNKNIDYSNAFCTGFGGPNENLQEIKNCIMKVVKTLPNWGKTIPLSWFHIENQIRKLKSSKIIMLDELLQKCIKSRVGVRNKNDLISPLRFLHNIGVILFFDEERLRNFVILDVQWFVDAFKHVITDEYHAKLDIPQDLYEDWKSFNNNGLLSSSLLFSIWKRCEQDNRYNAMKTEIISLMVKLNLLTTITPHVDTTGHGIWYCPCMNKQKFPTTEFENLQNSSLLCFKFRYVPKDLFHRLIAACGNQLKWRIVDMKFLCIYQTATVFFVEQSKVLVGMHSTDMILVQYLDLHNSKMPDYLGIRGKIAKLLDELTEKFVHCNYEVGYLCQKTVFGKSNISLSHFIPESKMEEEVINCAECGFNRKLAVKDIIWDTLKKNFNEDDDIMCAVPNTGLDVTERKEDDKEKTYKISADNDGKQMDVMNGNTERLVREECDEITSQSGKNDTWRMSCNHFIDLDNRFEYTNDKICKGSAEIKCPQCGTSCDKSELVQKFSISNSEKKAKPNMNKESRFKEKEDFKNERKSNTWKKQSHSELGQVYPYKQETCSF